MEKNERKDWMDKVEDAVFGEILHCVECHEPNEAKIWAEVLAKVGIV